jgi:hypothetical protein
VGVAGTVIDMWNLTIPAHVRSLLESANGTVELDAGAARDLAATLDALSSEVARLRDEERKALSLADLQVELGKYETRYGIKSSSLKAPRDIESIGDEVFWDWVRLYTAHEEARAADRSGMSKWQCPKCGVTMWARDLVSIGSATAKPRHVPCDAEMKLQV